MAFDGSHCSQHSHARCFDGAHRGAARGRRPGVAAFSAASSRSAAAVLLLVAVGGWRRRFRAKLAIQLRFGFIAVAVGVGCTHSIRLIGSLLLNTARWRCQCLLLGYKISMPFIARHSAVLANLGAHADAMRDEPTSPELFKTVLTCTGSSVYVQSSCRCLRKNYPHGCRTAEYYAAYRVVPLIMLAHLFYGVINIVGFGIFVARRCNIMHIYLRPPSRSTSC